MKNFGNRWGAGGVYKKQNFQLFTPVPSPAILNAIVVSKKKKKKKKKYHIL